MPHQLVIFDLDGTLVNTLKTIAEACNASLHKFGLPLHKIDAYRDFVGYGVSELISRAVPVDRQEMSEAVLRDYLPRLIDAGHEHVEPYPGIGELLDELMKRGVEAAICTNKPHPSALNVVKHVLGRWKFAMVQGHMEPFPAKPDPGMALHVAKEMGRDAKNCLFVGDSDIDIHTGLNAGMKPIGVSWGFRPVEELVAAGAARIVNEPTELLEIL